RAGNSRELQPTIPQGVKTRRTAIRESGKFMRKILPTSWTRFFGLAAIGTALIGSVVILVIESMPTRSEQAVRPDAAWAAAAPGRVEPKGRELRIVAPGPAVIKEVLVGLNDRIQKGDLLIRLDDEELKAKLAAAKAQVAVRTTDRDNVKASDAALDRRKAEDNLYNAERGAFDARMDLDHLISEARGGKVSLGDVQNGRAAVAAADEKVLQDQQKLKKVLAKDMPALKREEAALSAARADVSGVSASLERMRIRAPIDAAVLALNAKVGEMAGASAENPLLTLGDTVRLQVRAEVEERDVGKIYQGQSAVVKSDAFPNRTFEVRVATIAKALGAPQFSSRNRRKQADVDALEVVLDLEQGVPLLPGMRGDVLFREAATAPKSSSAGLQ
ncbi:MAG TPA: HlyD family efflux transporter periplasmic adaptor subunit, partial [Geobacterales bacterium]|nr:HlyD family efflux transporter periplasmic adaptor subunit [Geobacterales bacterium]